MFISCKLIETLIKYSFTLDRDNYRNKDSIYIVILLFRGWVSTTLAFNKLNKSTSNAVIIHYIIQHKSYIIHTFFKVLKKQSVQTIRRAFRSSSTSYQTKFDLMDLISNTLFPLLLLVFVVSAFSLINFKCMLNVVVFRSVEFLFSYLFRAAG